MEILKLSLLPIVIPENLLKEVPDPSRNCGDCSACCTVLAVTELNKPMRLACDSLCRDGCRIYESRPAGCRQFNCLWLRGAIDLPPGDDGLQPEELACAIESLRPDYSGVIWDYFVSSQSGLGEVIAFEIWSAAFQQEAFISFLKTVSRHYPVRLSFRNGEWQRITHPDDVDMLSDAERHTL